MQLSAQKDVALNSVLLPERFGPVTVLAPSASDSTDVSRVRSDSGLRRSRETGNGLPLLPSFRTCRSHAAVIISNMHAL